MQDCCVFFGSLFVYWSKCRTCFCKVRKPNAVKIPLRMKLAIGCVSALVFSSVTYCCRASASKFSQQVTTSAEAETRLVAVETLVAYVDIHVYKFGWCGTTLYIDGIETFSSA